MKNLILYSRNILIYLFKPSYDEITVFLISFTFIILFLMDTIFRSLIFGFLLPLINPLDFPGWPSREFIDSLLLTVAFFVGFILSVYHAFTKRPKEGFEKELMLFFVLAINAIAGVTSVIYMLKNSTGLLIVFPLLNIINSIVLIYQIGYINESWLSDAEASLPQIIIGIIAIVVIFIICHFIFNLHWTVMFSISVTYATDFNKIIQKYANFDVRCRFLNRL